MFNQQSEPEEEADLLPFNTIREADRLARQAREQQAAAEEAARNQPPPQPEDERQAIIARHVQAAQKEIEERSKLTAAQREHETLSGEFETISARYTELIKNASQNRPELARLEEQIKTKSARLEQLESTFAQEAKQRADAEWEVAETKRLAELANKPMVGMAMVPQKPRGR